MVSTLNETQLADLTAKNDLWGKVSNEKFDQLGKRVAKLGGLYAAVTKQLEDMACKHLAKE